MSATDLESSDAHAYFRAIEETFVRLRGAPLLLSPADWRVAEGWHREGIPLELVRCVLEEVFARRRERGARGRIQSLRYCVGAVERAWEEVRELSGPGRKAAAVPLAVEPRLEALAAALPADLPERSLWAGRITGLGGDSAGVEEALAALDGELLGRLEASLEESRRREVDARVEASLGALASRLTREEVNLAKERLRRQVLRQRLGLPVLSLFSPEAESGDQPS